MTTFKAGERVEVSIDSTFTKTREAEWQAFVQSHGESRHVVWVCDNKGDHRLAMFAHCRRPAPPPAMGLVGLVDGLRNFMANTDHAADKAFLSRCADELERFTKEVEQYKIGTSVVTGTIIKLARERDEARAEASEEYHSAAERFRAALGVETQEPQA